MKLNFFNKIRNKFKKKSGGAFSLNDLSIMMSTIAIVAVSAVAISNIESNNQKEKVDVEKIEIIYKAIGKFLVQKKRLPCPASITKIRGQDLSYGVESISTGNCLIGDGVYSISLDANLIYGMIPAQTLGLSSDFAQDQHGSKIVYIVDSRATYPADSPNENIGSIQNASIVVKENDVQISSDSLLIILTNGKNKSGAFSYNSSNYNTLPSATSLNERENSFTSISGNIINMNNIFVKSVKGDDVFDDDVFYKSRDSLIRDFNADFLIPCKNPGTKYGDQSAVYVYGQIVYASSACSFPNQSIVPAKKCGRDGGWIYEKSCPCYVSSEGVNSTYVSNGDGNIKCSKAGFDGVLKYHCDEESVLTILENCKRNCQFSRTGVSSISIANGAQKVACDQENNKGYYIVTCDNGNVISANGGCYDSRCLIGGYAGMRSQSVNSEDSGTLGICENGYSGSYSYSCYNGVSSVSNLCRKNCSFSIPGISSRTLAQGTHEFSCESGYSGGKVVASCEDGVINIKSGTCSLSGNCTVGIGKGMIGKVVPYNTSVTNDGECDNGYTGSYSYSCSDVGQSSTTNNCDKSACEVGKGEGMIAKNVSKGSSGEDGECSSGYGGYYKWSCSRDNIGVVIENNCVKSCKVGLVSQGGEGMMQSDVAFNKEGDQGLCDISKGYVGTYSWSCKLNPTTKKVEGVVKANNCKNYCSVGTPVQGSGMVQKNVAIRSSGSNGLCNDSQGYIGSYSWACDANGYGSVSSNKCANYCLVGTPSQGVGMIQKQTTLGSSGNNDGECNASMGYSGSYSWNCSDKGVGAVTQNNCVLKSCATIGGNSGMNQKTAIMAGQSGSDGTCSVGYRGSFSWNCSLKGVASTTNNCTKLKCQVPSASYPNLFSDLVDYTESTQILNCKDGYAGDGLSYTCSDNNEDFGTLSVSSYASCAQVTCTINNSSGFITGTIAPYSTTPQSYFCNDSSYNNFDTATFPACDSSKTLTATSNGCVKISCAIPDGNASNVAATSIFVGDNQNIACASDYASSFQVTASCSAVNANRPADGLSVPQSGSYTISGACSQVTCAIPLDKNTTLDGANVNFTASSVSLTCKPGYSGVISYTCDSNGLLSTTGACAPVTCAINSTVGFVVGTKLPYSTTPKNYYCNDPIYNNFGTATFPACDSSKTLTATSNGCVKISCAIPAGNASNVAATSIFIGSNQNIACASGYASSSQVTASCSAVNANRPADGLSADGLAPQSGSYTISGACALVQCTIPTGANTTIDGTKVNFSSSSVPLTCNAGYFSLTPSYTCNGSGVISIAGSCSLTVCTYTESGIGNRCLITTNETKMFATNTTGIMLCPYGAGAGNTQRDMKYKCNADQTLQYDIRPRCYSGTNPAFYAVFNTKHRYDTSTYSGNSCRWVSGKSGNNCAFTSVKCNIVPNYWSF